MVGYLMNKLGYKHYVLYTLLAVYIFNFVDRQILSLLMEPIKQDLDLSDTQLGFMSGIAFAIFYTTLGMPIAWLADRSNRVNIISIAITIWSGMTVISGFAANFWQLVIARIGVGIGEAGCTPPAHSIISDYFPRAERNRAISIYMMGVPIGVLFGFLIGGWINEEYGWRIAFISLGIPGLILAIILKMTVKEPTRSHDADSADTDVGAFTILETLTTMWEKRSFRSLVYGMGLVAFVGGGFGQWQAVHFIRHYGMNTAELGAWLSVMSGLAGALGIYLGGYLTERFAANNELLQMKIIVVSLLLMAVFGVMAFLGGDKHFALVSVGGANMLYYLHYGPAYSLILGLAKPGMRAMTSAIILFVVNLVGYGLGPQAAGLLSDILAPFFGDDALRVSILLMFTFVLPAAWGFLRAGKNLNQDLSEV